MLSIIVAMTQNNVIGKNNQIPWHLPADLKYFKKITMGSTMIMGRKTFESIGKPLPGRKNVVVTRQNPFTAEGVDVAHSLEEAIQLSNSKETFIIGGAELFRQVLEDVNQMYLTLVHKPYEGDTFFPEFNLEDWEITSREDHIADRENECAYSFLVLKKKNLIEE